MITAATSMAACSVTVNSHVGALGLSPYFSAMTKWATVIATTKMAARGHFTHLRLQKRMMHTNSLIIPSVNSVHHNSN